MLSRVIFGSLGAAVCAQPEIMVQFGPMETGGGLDLDDVVQLFHGPGLAAPAASHGHSLGRLFDDFFEGAGLPLPMQPRAMRLQRNRRRRWPEQEDGESHFVVRSGPSDFFQSLTPGNLTSVRAGEFQELFPVPPRASTEFESAEDDPHDMFLDNMMEHVTHTFKNTLLPVIRKVAAQQAPKAACDDDFKAFCPEAPSSLHCLGQHSDKISTACQENIGKSVPFLCAAPIEQKCNILSRGILPCLADHLEELGSSCRDAVKATHRLIIKANTQTATIVDPVSGETTVHEPRSKAKTPSSGPALEASPAVTPEVKLSQRLPVQIEQDDKPMSAPKMTFADTGMNSFAGNPESVKHNVISSVHLGAVLMATVACWYLLKPRIQAKKASGASLLSLDSKDYDENGSHIL